MDIDKTKALKVAAGIAVVIIIGLMITYGVTEAIDANLND